MTVKSQIILFTIYKTYVKRIKLHVPISEAVKFDSLYRVRNTLFPKYSINTLTEHLEELKKHNMLTYAGNYKAITFIRITTDGITYCQNHRKKMTLMPFKIALELLKKF